MQILDIQFYPMYQKQALLQSFKLVLIVFFFLTERTVFLKKTPVNGSFNITAFVDPTGWIL